MSIPFPGFCGPSYQYENKYAAVERLVNWFCLINEARTEENKFSFMLAPSPGNAPFSTLPVPAPFNHPNRGLIQNRGNVYGVNGAAVFNLAADGSMSLIGMINAAENDGLPCVMAANGNGQVMITSGGWGYIIPSGGPPNSLIRIDNGSGLLGCDFVTFQDGYFVVSRKSSNVIQISGDDATPIGDGTVWSSANVSAQAGQADYIAAVYSAREFLRLFGTRRSQLYQDVGNNGLGGFPFQSFNQTFIETGIGAPLSLAQFTDSLIWIGQDDRGMRACWRDAGASPERVSTFAVEQIWQNYARTDDAIAFTYTWRGNTMYQVTFPSAIVADPATGFPAGGALTYHSRTWVYSATASLVAGRPIWSERSFRTCYGFEEGRSERFHCYAFGLHLVGSVGIDGNPGAIYQYADDTTAGFTDSAVDVNGAQTQNQIVRDRICPHLYKGNDLIVYNQLEFELDRGRGADGGGAGSDPQILLRMSDDGGKTYGAEINVPAGAIGTYGMRVLASRLGAARDRVFWIRCTDPIYWSFVSAELELFECGV